MSLFPCPICGGTTHEIRAKLMCRDCGAILETCCEGGPMTGGCRPAGQPAQPEQTGDSQRG